MQKLGDPMDHVRLMARMGQTLGIDLVAAHAAGDLSQNEWAAMVQDCRGCEWGAGCSDWLETNDTAGQAPRPCPNRAVFRRLKSSRHARTGER